MLFTYVAIDSVNTKREGTVDAVTTEAAIKAIEERGYTVVSIEEIEEGSSILNFEINIFSGISNKDVVILSRQIATLFEAHVSPLRVFRLLSAEMDNKNLQRVLNTVVDDLQGGATISTALESHPEVFSNFYISLVRAGEESGSLEKSFNYLADYLDRSYEISSKTRNALIYPAFVIGIFVIVMVLMLTTVVPNIANILTESGQELPIYTKIVIGISDFLVGFYPLILLLAAGGIGGGVYFKKTPIGRRYFDGLLISLPVIGVLQRKLVLTRFCDNMATMLSSGISVVQALEVTGDVVGNTAYREIIEAATEDVKAGKSLADSISEYPEIPGVLAQMVKVGEETGSLSPILGTLAVFYRREVNNAVDTMISLIEPIMIVMLGLGVGTLLASVLMPIYNLTSSF